jgi:hypothetical protein
MFTPRINPTGSKVKRILLRSQPQRDQCGGREVWQTSIHTPSPHAKRSRMNSALYNQEADYRFRNHLSSDMAVSYIKLFSQLYSFLMLYFTLVMSKLEYACIAWNMFKFYWRQQAWKHWAKVFSPMLQPFIFSDLLYIGECFRYLNVHNALGGIIKTFSC